MTRLLALDVGEKRVGVAISDEIRVLARPLTCILRSTLEAEIETLIGLLAEYQVEKLIIGYPRSLSGDEGPQALRVKHYAEQLAAAVPAPVILWDERYSTVVATERLAQSTRKSRARTDKGYIDAAAAAVILQDYIDTEFQNRERGQSE